MFFQRELQVRRVPCVEVLYVKCPEAHVAPNFQSVHWFLGNLFVFRLQMPPLHRPPRNCPVLPPLKLHVPMAPEWRRYSWLLKSKLGLEPMVIRFRVSDYNEVFWNIFFSVHTESTLGVHWIDSDSVQAERLPFQWINVCFRKLWIHLHRTRHLLQWFNHRDSGW